MFYLTELGTISEQRDKWLWLKNTLLDSYKIWSFFYIITLQQPSSPPIFLVISLFRWQRIHSVSPEVTFVPLSILSRYWQNYFHERRLWVVQTRKNQMGQVLDCTRNKARPLNLVFQAYHAALAAACWFNLLFQHLTVAMFIDSSQ